MCNHVQRCLRDALSILDKIVSFTNGELNYSNTLEHLNILDEDYYFRLMDHMQQQQLSEAMLLFDEINQKGFEGDTLLEGYAEFIRNLLVSKDAKAAVLLEVADDFRQKYLQATQKISTGWLIAALNVLNHAEINYKQARNKRLHMELVIIKLCYLQQAMELVQNEGLVSKKGSVESAKPVAFRAIPVIRVKEEGRSINPKPQKGLPEKARLIIEEPLANEFTQPASNPVTRNPQATTLSPKTPLGSLLKIRQKVSDQNKNGTAVKDLSDEELYISWGAFIEKLNERKNHSAVSNFKMALLRILDNNSIEIVTENNIQQKFIEQERAALVDHLQNHFSNKQLAYTVVVAEQDNKEQSGEKRLSTKEQYLKIIEEYPLVKELKDRLRLELDY